MATLEALSKALRSGAQGQAQLAGLDEKYARANSLRDNTAITVDQYGQSSPLAAIADLFNDATGRRMLKEVEAPRAQARQDIAQAENALPMYKAGVNADAVTYGKEQDADARTFRDDKFTYQQEQDVNANTFRDDKFTYQQEQDAIAAKNLRGKQNRDEAFAERKLALERSIAAQKRMEFYEANALTKASNAQKVKEAGSVVKLVSRTDPEDQIMVGKVGDEYTDVNTGERFDPTGYVEADKVTRGSGSRYIRAKSEDPFGNDVVTIFDKSTGEEQTASFGDGTPYNMAEAKIRAGQRAQQAGDETYAKEAAKVAQTEAVAAGAETARLYISLSEMEKGLDALDSGAETGPIASILPTIRDSTVRLQSAVDNLALSDIGKYTFGSLSEAEAAWLRTSNLPMKLDEESLRGWLQKRTDAVRRAIDVSKYVHLMRKGRHEPDQDVIDQILRQGGFTYED